LTIHAGGADAVALGMIGLILVQHGKGADMGAAFGSGGSGSLFGASGSANFLSRTTAVLATCFLSARWLLAYFGNLRPPSSGQRAGAAPPCLQPCLPWASGAANSHGRPRHARCPAGTRIGHRAVQIPAK
jgi:preprotein translocase subunit SecG